MRIINKVIITVSLVFMVFLKHGYAQNRDSLNLYDLSLDQLMNLQISSASKSSEAVTDIPSSIVIISRQTIQEQGWQTLEEILCNVPGMYMINDYLWFGTDNFGVRGFFSTGSFNAMVVMVNGVTQKEDWYNSFPLTKVNVPVEAIDRIEIIRGPMSVIYGNSAFLGAINIVTDQNSSKGSAKVSIGNNGNFRTYARLSGESDKIAYTFNASVYGSDGIDRPYSEMTDHIDQSWGLPQNATSNRQLTDHRKYFDFSLSTNGFHFTASQTNTKRGVIDYYPGFDDGHLAEIQSSNALVGYSKTLSNAFNFNFDIGYYSFRNRLSYKHNSDTTAYGFNDIYSDAMDAELNINLKPVKNLDISVGTYYQMVFRDKLVVDAPNLSINYVNLDAGLSNNNTKQTWAAFTQANYSVNQKLSILGGLRIEQTPSYTINYAVRFDPSGNYDYLARNGTYKYGEPYLIPRIALLYHFNESQHVKVMYGQAIKQASMGENMDIVRYPDRDQLKPANMQTIEINYTGRITSKSMVNISLFQNNVENLISRTNQMVNGEMKLFNTNSGKLKTLGTELSTDLKFAKKINASFSFAYQNSENMQKGYENITLEYAPKILAYSTLSYRFYKNSTIALSGYYIGSMEAYWLPDTRDVNDPNDTRDPIQLIADGHRIGSKAPAYFLANLNIRFNNFFNKNLYCTFHVHNLFDKDIKFPTTRSNDEFEKGTFGYSRYFIIGLGINFDSSSEKTEPEK